MIGFEREENFCIDVKTILPSILNSVACKGFPVHTNAFYLLLVDSSRSWAGTSSAELIQGCKDILDKRDQVNANVAKSVLESAATALMIDSCDNCENADGVDVFELKIECEISTTKATTKQTGRKRNVMDKGAATSATA